MMSGSENTQWVLKCPRYVVGLAILLWGVTTGQILIAGILAAMIEIVWMFSFRWKFTYGHIARAWYLCCVFGVLGVVLYLIDGKQLYHLRGLFAWLPLILFPLMFVQRYGASESVPLNTFSFVSRRRMRAAEADGESYYPIMVNLGLPYIGCCLISAAIGEYVKANDYFLYVMMIIFAVTLFKASSSFGNRWAVFTVIFALMTVLSIGVRSSLVSMERRVLNNQNILEDDDPTFDTGETSIGELGKLKLSKKVHWRLWMPSAGGGEEAKLACVTTFDTYKINRWSSSYTLLPAEKRYSNATTIDVDENTTFRYFDNETGKEVYDLDLNSGYRFRGSINTKTKDAGGAPVFSVPTISGFFAVANLLGEEADLEVSSTGNMRITNRDSTMDYTVFSKSGPQINEGKPVARVDYSVLSYGNSYKYQYDEQVFDKIISELGLSREKPYEAVKRLAFFFREEFEYTTHLSIKEHRSTRTKSALAVFLEDERRGHCEYYATATTLILRRLGIPTRYATGYSIREKKKDHYILRGNHAHAWCKAWIGGKWQDVDITPPDWAELDGEGKPSVMDNLTDWWKRVREDFQVWRGDSRNAVTITYAMLVLGTLVIIWVIFRLWRAKNKQSVSTARESTFAEMPPWKFMKRVDRWVRKKVGVRPSSMPYGSWLGQLHDEFPENGELIEKLINTYHRARFSQAQEDQSLLDDMLDVSDKIARLKAAK